MPRCNQYASKCRQHNERRTAYRSDNYLGRHAETPQPNLTILPTCCILPLKMPLVKYGEIWLWRFGMKPETVITTVSRAVLIVLATF